MADRLEIMRIVDPVLSNIALGYGDPEFVGEALFPIVPVAKEAGEFIKYGKEAFRIYNAIRAIRGRSARIDFSASTAQYQTLEYSVEAALDDRETAEATPPLNPEMVHTKITMKAILRAREKRYATLATASANYATGNKDTLSGDDQWSNDNSNPILAIEDAKDVVGGKIGIEPNTLLLGRKVYKALKNHPKILERIQYSQRGVITVELLAEILDIPRIVAARSMYASGKPGSETFSDIWGRYAVLAYVPAAQDAANGVPSYGYTFRRQGYPKTSRYRDEPHKSNIIETSDNTDEKMCSDIAGFLWTDAVAA